MRFAPSVCRVLSIAPVLVLTIGCGGGDDPPSPPPENWARLRDFSVTPGTIRAPASAAEVQQFRADFIADFQSNTYQPTFLIVGHLIPKGETLVSSQTTVNRLVSQWCGQQAFACGDPFTRMCSYSAGWTNTANRRIICDANNPAIEVQPGEYQYIASVCYTDSKGTNNCTSKTVPITLQ